MSNYTQAKNIIEKEAQYPSEVERQRALVYAVLAVVDELRSIRLNKR